MITRAQKRDAFFEPSSRFRLLLEHDLFRPAFARRSFKPNDERCNGFRAGGKPVSTFRDHALTIALTAGSALMVATAAKAAEIKLMCSGAMRPALEELAPQFERASGHKLTITYSGTNIIRERALAGDAGDLVIFASYAVEDVIRQGKLAAKVDLVRSGVGVGVRAGSPRPDLSSADAFKRALLAAKSFARSEGPSGVYIAALLERLGIAEQMKGKTVVVRGRLVGDALVKGEAEIGVQQVSELKSVPGVDVLPMPAEIQNITVFSAGLTAAAQASEPVQALIKFLTSPAAAAVIKAKGLDPA
jgi:molybdate transport system substrate-binding protein